MRKKDEFLYIWVNKKLYKFQFHFNHNKVPFAVPCRGGGITEGRMNKNINESFIHRSNMGDIILFKLSLAPFIKHLPASLPHAM